MPYSRHIPLPGSHNLRDLGGYAGRHGPTAWRRLLRADSLHRLTPEAMAELRDAGVATVIDLRHEGERETMPNPFAADYPGVSYRNVSLFEGLDPAAAHEADDVLLDLYIQALEESGPAFAEIFRIVAAAPKAALFHCTVGKDRTGVVAAMLLLLAGVPREEIVADYVLTGERAPAMFADLHREILARGGAFDLSSPLLRSEAATMEAFLDRLETAHGGVEVYLGRVGVSDAEIDRLRRRLGPGG